MFANSVIARKNDEPRNPVIARNEAIQIQAPQSGLLRSSQWRRPVSSSLFFAGDFSHARRSQWRKKVDLFRNDSKGGIKKPQQGIILCGIVGKKWRNVLKERCLPSPHHVVECQWVIALCAGWCVVVLGHVNYALWIVFIKSSGLTPACFKIALNVPSGISPVRFGMVVNLFVWGLYQISWLPAAGR